MKKNIDQDSLFVESLQGRGGFIFLFFIFTEHNLRNKGGSETVSQPRNGRYIMDTSVTTKEGRLATVS
jgi:hypothetical protein